MGFALMPHSLVSYEISRQDSLPNIGRFDRQFNGSGGLYKVLWGNAVKYKNLSIGVNLGYLFGKIDYERNIDFTERIEAFDNLFSNSYSVRGLYWKTGILYSWTLNKAELEDNIGREEPVIVSFGLTAKTNTSFSTTSDISYTNFNAVGGLGSTVDTLVSQTGVEGKGRLPAEISFGVTYYHRSKLAIGIDFSRTFWSNYKNDANPETLNNTFRLSLGGYYRPDRRSLGSLFTRSYYRFGVFFEQDPRVIESERIDNFGVTMGLGLPFILQRKISHANIGLSYGRRAVSNILKENYINISFGFTFNDDEWFIKRKFN